MSNRIENIQENGGIKKVRISELKDDVFDIFSNYQKEIFYHDGSVRTENLVHFPSESEMARLGFFYAGHIAGTFEYVFDGIVRSEKPTPKEEILF